ncbi:MAG: hypothetical protein J5822_01525 [Eubacteriaceae bacterium]|nr:hypothetical protein [Eubacteriaceae bacterium]
MEKDNATKSSTLSRVYSMVLGDQSRILHIKSDGEELISAPLMLVVLLLFVFDIPSWVIGTLLLILALFEMDIVTDAKKARSPLSRATVSVSEYKSRMPENAVKTDKEGYSEIIIR